MCTFCMCLTKADIVLVTTPEVHVLIQGKHMIDKIIISTKI